MEAAGAVASSISSFFTALAGEMASDCGGAVMGVKAKLWSWDTAGGAKAAAPAGIDALLEGMRQAWRAGDAAAFAAFHAADARFVAFDGSVLTGPDAIAAFHARPFATVLADSEVRFDEMTTRSLGSGC